MRARCGTGDYPLGRLLKLRTRPIYGAPLVARHALILLAQVEPEQIASSRFAMLMNTDNNNEELKQAWSARMNTLPMSQQEFGEIVGRLVIVNLFAKFGEDVNAKETTQKFEVWTGMNWYTLRELVQQLDQVLNSCFRRSSVNNVKGDARCRRAMATANTICYVGMAAVSVIPRCKS